MMKERRQLKGIMKQLMFKMYEGIAKGRPHSYFLQLTDELHDVVMPPSGACMEGNGATLWTRADPDTSMQDVDERKRTAHDSTFFYPLPLHTSFIVSDLVWGGGRDG